MKKLRYIFTLLVSTVLFAGCASDDQIGTFGNLSQDDTFVAISEAGGDATITINANQSWAFDEIFSTTQTIDGQKVTTKHALPAWLTASTLSGSAGQTRVTFHADATNGGREAELRLTVDGQKQFIKVRQGSMEASPSTCAQIIAGPDGKTYRVTGTVKSIANTTYGNWYLEDATGEVYIYGTLDANGGTKNFSSLGIEVGDVVTVEGPKTTYNGTVELVDVTVVKIVKSLIKVITPNAEVAKEGADITVKVAYKGNGSNLSIPADAQSWVKLQKSEYKAGIKTIYDTAQPADTTIYYIGVDANEGEGRTAILEFSSANASSSSTVAYTIKQAANVLPHGENPEDPYTVAEAIAKCVEIGNSSDGVIYYAKGIVSSISSIDTGSYGNATFKISDDGTDDKAITVFRSYFLNNEKFTSEDQIHVGDEVIITGKLVNYKGETPEFSGNVYVYSIKKGSNEPGSLKNPFTPAQANAFIATLEADKATEDDYYIKGKIIEITDKNQFNTTYGNCTFYISDDGTDKDDKFYVFRTYYLGNVKYTDDSWTKPQAGDEVIICGKLVNYKGNTPETSANKSYIYSLNGNR